jgi:hypothetical protein
MQVKTARVKRNARLPIFARLYVEVIFLSPTVVLLSTVVVSLTSTF